MSSSDPFATHSAEDVQHDFERKECDGTPDDAAATSRDRTGDDKVQVKTEPKVQEPHLAPLVKGIHALSVSGDARGSANHYASEMAVAYSELNKSFKSILEVCGSEPDPCEDLEKLESAQPEIIRRNRAAARIASFLQANRLAIEDFERYESYVEQVLSGGAVEPLGPSDAPESVAYVKSANKRQQIVLPLGKAFVCMLGMISNDELTEEVMLKIYRLLFAAGASALDERHGLRRGGYSQFCRRSNSTWNYEWYMGQMRKQGAFEKVLAVHAVCRREYLWIRHNHEVALHKLHPAFFSRY